MVYPVGGAPTVGTEYALPMADAASFRAEGDKRLSAELLAEPRVLSKLVVSEIEADAKRFGDPRLTLIEAVAPLAASRVVPDEPITITLSRHGWIR